MRLGVGGLSAISSRLLLQNPCPFKVVQLSSGFGSLAHAGQSSHPIVRSFRRVGAIGGFPGFNWLVFVAQGRGSRHVRVGEWRPSADWFPIETL